MRKILVTPALPYANGPIHLGHILEHIQADIWVRWQKLQGNNCIFVCGDDAHGTPVMLSARKEGIDPVALIARVKKQHEADFAGFNINFDNFYTTHSEENLELATVIYERLLGNGDIEIKTVEQAFDPIGQMFLPDRFVKGTCPRCKAKDQYGDNCEVCGATYSPADLIEPVSVISGATPIQKKSKHYFFKLSNYAAMLQEWINSDHHLQPEIAHKLAEWFKVGLKPWDISRDEPYFGFKIPKTVDKYFYVWMDAPIGYMASFRNLCKRRADLNFDEYWKRDSQVELYHFVGKDIVYFHALFWPAMLEGVQLRKPTAIFTHGYLTVNGEKMSKSRGTFILASDYLERLNPEYLRYYFAAKTGNGIDDLDLNLNDFVQRVNSDLVGKVVNIASRCAKFINKNFQNKLAAKLSDTALYEHAIGVREKIASLYEARDYNSAVRSIMELADHVNQYIDEKKPWSLAKNNPTDPEIQNICTMGLNLFRVIMIYLQPIVPKLAADVAMFFNATLQWGDLKQPLLNHQINEFAPLMQRVDVAKVNELLQM
jgi:methionyl-tRNA synthetase